MHSESALQEEHVQLQGIHFDKCLFFLEHINILTYKMLIIISKALYPCPLCQKFSQVKATIW